MDTKHTAVWEHGERSRSVFKHIVEAFVETGGPIGSRTLSRRIGVDLSPATIRNVMADLEDAGLLYAPHVSAGRLPTEVGLRMFVDGILEIGNLTSDERTDIESRFAGTGRNLETVLEEAGSALSGLSNCAGLVFAPKTESPLKHIEFINLSPGRALVVMVTAEGVVENRIIEVPADVPASAFVEASNFLNARLVGHTIAEARANIKVGLDENRGQLDQLSAKLVEAGLATRAGDTDSGLLIVRGQSHLLDDVSAMTDLEHIRSLFSALETGELMLKVLEMADGAEGVQIFIGSDNDLFNLSGCSFIVAPYHSSQSDVVGAIGVIGPTRMNYARIIPMVDYTAKLISNLFD
ncbi:MAG: heat-inducible transcriptional repressor HrcA [Rhodospirillales bacterium]|nr:heat-inducible transcriptional repressor HrcA [Rhodospirillales bacterium]